MPLKSLGGPILIAQVAGKQAEIGVTHLVQFLAALASISSCSTSCHPDSGWRAPVFLHGGGDSGQAPAVAAPEDGPGIGPDAAPALMILAFYQEFCA